MGARRWKVVRHGRAEQRGKGPGASQEGADTPEKSWSRRFMLGWEWGSESALVRTLWQRGRPEVRCSEGLGAAEEEEFFILF